MSIPTGIEVEQHPPSTDGDDEPDQPITNVTVHVCPSDGSHTDASTTLLGDLADDPTTVANAVIRAALGAAAAVGPAQHWAMVCALRDFQGGRS